MACLFSCYFLRGGEYHQITLLAQNGVEDSIRFFSTSRQRFADELGPRVWRLQQTKSKNSACSFSCSLPGTRYLYSLNVPRSQNGGWRSPRDSRHFGRALGRQRGRKTEDWSLSLISSASCWWYVCHLCQLVTVILITQSRDLCYTLLKRRHRITSAFLVLYN